MEPSVVVALIMLVGTIASQIIISRGNIRVNKQNHEQSAKLIVYRMDQLETKMDEHNDFMKRFIVVETNVKGISQTLNNLESDHRKILMGGEIHGK